MEPNIKPQNAAPKWLPLILGLFVLIQPLLDILTAIGAYAGHAVTAGAVVRPLFMAFGFFYVVFVSRFEGKKRCLIYYGVLIVYLILFMGRMFTLDGLSLCVSNAKELVKTFFAPFVLVFLYTVYKQYGHVVSTRVIAWTGALYTGVILTAFLTGTSRTSYANSGFGYNGWFYAANEIGCIVSILAPITIYYCIKQLPAVTRKTWWKGVLIAFALISAAFSANFIGTKVVFAFTACYSVVSCLWSGIRWLQTRDFRFALRFAVLLVLSILVIGLYSISPLRGYINDIYIPIEIKDSEIAAVSIGEVVQQSSSGTWLRDLIDSNPLVGKLDWLLSRRLLTASSSLQVYLDGGLFTKLVGIGYANASSYSRDVSYMIEMDPFAILVRHGILGILVYILPYFAAIVYFIIQFFRHIAKRLSSLEYCSYLYSTLAGLAIALLAGHALVSPAVSIFVIVNGLSLWAITHRQNQAFGKN